MTIEKNKHKISRNNTIYYNNYNKNVIIMNIVNILDDLHKNDEFNNSMLALFKPYINLIVDKISIYLIIFILLVLISFILHLGILIILIKYLKNK